MEIILTEQSQVQTYSAVQHKNKNKVSFDTQLPNGKLNVFAYMVVVSTLISAIDVVFVFCLPDKYGRL